MVILAPISQLGCRRASALVTPSREANDLPLKGPPEAVKMTFSMGLWVSPARH